MIYFAISGIMFFSMVFVHVCIHRYLEAIGKNSLLTLSVYIMGLAILVPVIWYYDAATPYNRIPDLLTQPAPVSSVLLYGFLSLAHAMLFISYMLESESPSERMLFLIRSRDGVTFKEIRKLFADEEIVKRRIKLLENQKQVSVKGGKITASPKALKVAAMISWYRNLFRWGPGG